MARRWHSYPSTQPSGPLGLPRPQASVPLFVHRQEGGSRIAVRVCCAGLRCEHGSHSAHWPQAHGVAGTQSLAVCQVREVEAVPQPACVQGLVTSPGQMVHMPIWTKCVLGWSGSHMAHCPLNSCKVIGARSVGVCVSDSRFQHSESSFSV